MKRESLVFFFGVLVIVMPFLGIPNAWKRIGLVGIGAFLIIIGYQLRRLSFLRSIEHTDGERKAEAFVENTHRAAASSPMQMPVSALEVPPKKTTTRRRSSTRQLHEV